MQIQSKKVKAAKSGFLPSPFRPRLLKALWGAGTLAWILSAGPASKSASAQRVSVQPGDNLQSLVNTHPPGTTFVISPGTYRMQSISPKDKDSFVGEPGAVLSGAEVLTSFTHTDQYWVANVSVKSQGSYRGKCDKNHPACMFPEDLFIDGVPLQRVTDLSDVSPGKWYLDYSTGKAYAGSNPNGQITELSAIRAAFWGSASNVTIKGLTIEKYACIAGKGAINAMAALTGYGPVGSGWVVDSNDLYLNHGLGVRVSDGMVVSNNKIHDNGQMGLAGTGNNILVKDNEVYRNNYAGYEWDWEAGGAKIGYYSKNVTFSNNYVHDNKGPGLHGDIGDDYFVFENNHTARNFGSGIHYEISYHAVIRNNLIEGDGFGSTAGTSFWYGGGILVSNSSDVEVYGNTVTDCMNGIGGTQANRGTDAKTGLPYNLTNLYVHNNIITQSTGIAAGIVSSRVFGDLVFNSWHNLFVNNAYRLGNGSGRYFEWMNVPQTHAEWQARGQGE